MRVFGPILIAVIVLILSYIIQRAINRSRGYSSAQKDDYGRGCELLVYDMFRTRFPRKNVFCNLYLPVDRGGETFWTETDVVCVTRGGVIVCEVKGAKGIITSPEEGDWTQKYRDKEITFQNPYVQNKGHIASLMKVLARGGFKNLPVYNIVVYTDKSTKFTQRHKWLMRADLAVEFAAKIDDRCDLTSKEVKGIDAVLSAYRKKRTPTAASRYSQNMSV